MKIDASARERVSDYWGSKDGYAPNWYSFCADYISQLITGSAELSPTLWAIQRFAPLKPVENALELGCLSGEKLIATVQGGLALKGHGVDIAKAGIKAAAELAFEKGLQERVTFSLMDLNKPALDPESFDIAIANGVLHHIANLEECLANVYASLRPGGCLFASEFTGPSRYRYSDEDIRLINEGIDLLPPELRPNTPFGMDHVQPKLDADPSEAIRSEEIEDILNRTFEEVATRPYGGNVLMRALTQDFFRGFSNENPTHREAISKLLAFETRLLANGLRSHHTYFIAKKRPGEPLHNDASRLHSQK